MRLKPSSGARRLALFLAGLMLVLALFPSALPLLDWSRAAILHGQWHRLITAHLVHLGVWHLTLNLLSLLLLAELFWHEMSTRTAAALLLVSALGVGIGLLWAAPDLWRYAGLSGVLHGAWAGSALLLLQGVARQSSDQRSSDQRSSDQRSSDQRSSDRQDPARLWWALALLALAAKLAMENLSGTSLAQHSIGAPVILQSHALGALTGLGFAGLAWLAKLARGASPAVASAAVFD